MKSLRNTTTNTTTTTLQEVLYSYDEPYIHTIRTKASHPLLHPPGIQFRTSYILFRNVFLPK